MGCFGWGIFESDDAMDWEGELFDAAEFDRDKNDDLSSEARAALEKHLDKLIAVVRNWRPFRADDDREGFYRAVGYQVLAGMLMHVGAAMTEEQRAILLTGVSACPEYRAASMTEAQFREHLQNKFGTVDEEMVADFIEFNDTERSKGRKFAIDVLYQALVDYDIGGGKPVPVGSFAHFESTGLLKQATEVGLL